MLLTVRWMRKTRNSFLQFVRYALVGGFAALIDSACLFLLYARLGVNHLIAAATGFLVGLLINYAISIAWVFETTGRFKQEFTLFSVIGVGGLLWTELILWLSVDRAHIPVMPAKALALFLVLLWNFGMRKKFVFAPVTEQR